MNSDRSPPLVILFAILLAAGVGSMLVWALWSLQTDAPGLSALVQERLPESGVRAKVTAVLLNFRGYDTLLEVAVLFAALLGSWHLGPMHLPHSYLKTGAVMENLARHLIPIIILVSGYLLWLGGHAAGGAFQAGALLAGAGVLRLVVHPGKATLQDGLQLRTVIIIGPLLFTLVAGAVMLTGRNLLEYPPEHAGGLILLIEAACTLSIGITLVLLFAGGRPDSGGKQ